MASLQVRWPELSATKQKALDDAQKMQKRIIEQCNKAGKEVPPYQLSELIGKGSFGRVYKSKSLQTKQLVAVKIIDIDQSDTMNPGMSDTYSDLLKELNALQLLRVSGAKNINHVIEALPVGQSMWVITEYCAGGSVSTLMRPTAPGGLQEKWIIPILREVAEALYWVHDQGVIHRDIKCANVLVTEEGNVQLCDFGVAGVIENKFDKRTTMIGTPHWMAPELFDPTISYGTEVDIWAYGALVYEIASGMPPNVSAGMDLSKLGAYLKQHAPRLEGDQYSAGLKDLVAYCMQHDPAKRPPITMIQRHGYIYKTEEAYPSSSLSHLVRGFKLWESQGGARKSLFNLGGAQAPADISTMPFPNDEWNFSTTAAFDQQVFNNGDAQDVYDVYGTNVEVDLAQEDAYEETARPRQKGKGRRRPPPHLPSVKVPLEKLFDPNTMTSYEDNSRTYYGRPMLPPPASDLPLRDDSAPTSDVRESLIDLDASFDAIGAEPGDFHFDTMTSGDSLDYNDYGGPENAPLSDPADGRDNRRTQDWTFPSQPMPASANPDLAGFPHSDGPPSIETFKFPMAPDDGRPTLVHRPTEPLPPSATFNDLAPSAPPNMDLRASMGSLIDLDMSLADPPAPFARPSTSHSEAGSVSGSEFGGGNPFELEKHASVYAMPSTYREPSIFVSDDSEFSHAVAELSLSNSERGYPDDQLPVDNTNLQEPSPVSTATARPYSLSEFAGMDPEDMDDPTPSANAPASQDIEYFPPSVSQQDLQRELDEHIRQSGGKALPPLPVAPSPQAMQGQASSHEVKDELRRMAMTLREHLGYVNTHLSGMSAERRTSNSMRLEPVEGVL
ncbi:S TKc [Geosmithia morbida]|uniref:non-specific serine/threonine protein kinase n=1 Tax=Geosmithia morbida TaxID=1094350 RepID=A0A9P4YW26_9HYPO|nr:S TKc [Geosmithia morbida]KAF4124161.1 S TKc [Geosmithia morbida]